MELTVQIPYRFLLLFLASVSIENARSASAFEGGSVRSRLDKDNNFENIFPPLFVVKTPIAIHISSQESLDHCSLISGLSSDKDLHSFPIAI